MQRAHPLAAVTFIYLIPQTFAKWLFAKNDCPFAIWCTGAKNDHTFIPSSLVLPGQVYWSWLTADNDNIGAVLKCALNPQIQQPYQMEVNVQYGLSWLDLSAIDGDPFLAYHRHAEINGGKCVVDCPPGSTACEYPVQTTCMTTDDAVLYLCSRGPFSGL